MRIYGGKHLGGGFAIGISTRIGSYGGRGRNNDLSDSDGYLSITIAVIIIVLLFSFTQNFILSIVIGVVALVIIEAIKIDRRQKAEENIRMNNEITKASQKILKYIDFIENGKLLSSRENNCTKAIVLLNKLERMNLNNDQAQYISDVLEFLLSTQRVLPVSDLLLKAEKAEFKRQNKKAIDFYLDVLYEFKKGHISDSDFNLLQLMDENSGKVITKSRIVEAAKTLGWKDKIVPAIASNIDNKIMINCPECNSRLSLSNFSIKSDGTGICPICDNNVTL